MLNKVVNHDVTRVVSSPDWGSQALWHQLKLLVQQVDKGLPPEQQCCLLLDHTIIEKTYTDENRLDMVHYDHSQDQCY